MQQMVENNGSYRCSHVVKAVLSEFIKDRVRLGEGPCSLNWILEIRITEKVMTELAMHTTKHYR